MMMVLAFLRRFNEAGKVKFHWLGSSALYLGRVACSSSLSQLSKNKCKGKDPDWHLAPDDEIETANLLTFTGWLLKL